MGSNFEKHIHHKEKHKEKSEKNKDKYCNVIRLDLKKSTLEFCHVLGLLSTYF